MASSRAKIKRPCVPRAVVQKELEDALAKDTYTSLNAVAASMGFRSTARFYKEKCFSDLAQDRKSTRLNSSHTVISYAVFCLKKKKKKSTLRGFKCR